MRQFFQEKKGRIPDPTFGEYYQIFASYNTYEDRGYLLQDLTQYVEESDDVVVFVNPNNPTGTEIDSLELLNLAKKYPNKLFAIDESFIEFSQYKSLIVKLDKTSQDNIIIIKSLSKSLGLPGIRLGYVYSTNRDFLDFIRKNLPIWNINSMAEHFLEIIIKHKNAIKKSFADTIADRQSFSEGLVACPIIKRVFNSGGNFITVEFSIDRHKFNNLIDELLHQHKIHVKDLSGKFKDGKSYMRLAVRTTKENANLVKIFNSQTKQLTKSRIGEYV